MANPLVCTNMVWDSDVNPEGFFVGYKPKCGPVEPFAGVAYFILDDTRTGTDVTTATMQAFQAGFDWTIVKDVKWTTAATYYNFDGLPTGYRAANGNDVFPPGHLAANGFRTINLTNMVGFPVCGLPVNVFFDWVHNCADTDSQPDFTNQSDGFNAGVKVGKNKKKGDWSVGYRYAYIEANSTPGELNDSDFEYSNRKGHVFSATYNIADFLTVGAEVFWTRRVVDPGGNTNGDVDSFIDLVWSF